MQTYSNMNAVYVETLIIKMYHSLEEWKEFKSVVRDLMISTRSFGSQENTFYEHERKVSSDLKSNFAL